MDQGGAIRTSVAVVRCPSFRRLLLAQAISALGDWITNVALILLVVRLTEHPGAAALVLVAKLVPRALTYPFGGLLADHLDRSRLMIAADLGRAGLVASLLLVQSADQLWWVLLATALAQVLSSLFNPAAMAAVPSLVPSERLGAANALLSAVKEAAFFVGPLLGSLAVIAGEVSLAFALDAASFVVSAVLLAGLGRAGRPSTARPPLQFRRDLALGGRTVLEHPGLRVIFAGQIVLNTLIVMLNVLLVPLLVTHWQAPEALLGTLYAAVGIGSIAGSVLALRVAPARYLGTALAMLVVMGAATLGLGLAPWLWLGLGCFLVIGIANMIGDVVSNAFVQTAVADDRLGRVFGLLFWGIALGQAIGAGIGWVAGLVAPALLVSGLGLAALAATLLLARAPRATAQVPARLAQAAPPS